MIPNKTQKRIKYANIQFDIEDSKLNTFLTLIENLKVILSGLIFWGSLYYLKNLGL